MVRSLELSFNVFYRLFGLQLLNIGQPLEMPFIVLALERYIHQLSTSIADRYIRRVWLNGPIAIVRAPIGHTKRHTRKPSVVHRTGLQHK